MSNLITIDPVLLTAEIARSFIQASLVWLALGVTVGAAMAVHPAWTIYRPVHMDMTLLGFVTMMIERRERTATLVSRSRGNAA